MESGGDNTAGETMLMVINNLSIRHKLFSAFGLVLIVLVIQGSSAISSLSGVHDQVNQVVNHTQPAVLRSMEIAASLQRTSSALGFYLLSKEPQHKAAYQEGLTKVTELLQALRKLPAIQNDPASIQLVAAITSDIVKFKGFRERMLTLAQSDNENIPAIAYASEHINPIFREMIQQLGQMILAEESEDASEERKTFLAEINALRFSWANLNNELRLYLAFRTSSALDNLKIYTDRVLQQTEALAESGDLLNFEQEEAYANFSASLPMFLENLKQLVELHGSDRWRSDAYLIRSELTPLLNHINSSIEQLITHQRQAIDTAQQETTTIYEESRLSFLLLGLLVVILVALLAWLLANNITRPLMRAVGIANGIANGNLDNRIDTSRQDETGALLKSLDTMQADLRKRIEQEQQIAAENLRIRYALDHVSSPVTVSNDQNKLIYINQAAISLFETMAPQLREQVPEFDHQQMIGSSLSSLFTDSALVKAYQSRLDTQQQYDTEITGHKLHLIASPVYDDQGEYRGRVTQWVDRTDQILVEEQIDALVEAAGRGDLQQRIDLTGKSGFLLQLGTGFNKLMEQLSNVFSDIERAMSKMAKGDLTHSINGEYQGTFGTVKEDVNQTLDNLQQVIRELHTSTDMIAAQSADITRDNSALSSRTEQQASSLEETASSMEELTSTVRNNANNAQQANQLAASARQHAEEGGKVVSEAIQAMQEINTASNRIAEIIGVIDEIAFQTNLLALNVSVEAARAGEQGRGFAVVAMEVRNLASRSATAAKEIKTLIQDSVEKVQSGSELVNRSGSTLEDILGGVKKVGDIIAEIAAASQQQASGIDQINHAVTNMDAMTQQNASLAEQTSSASAAMKQKALDMQQRIGFFRIQ